MATLLTLGQAAKETGISKPTISKAISNGKLSAFKNESGEYQIDPSELFRVYSPASKDKQENFQSETPIVYAGLQREVKVLRELMEEIKEQRDDFRQRLDHAEKARDEEAEERRKAADELRRLTLLITHQPANQSEPQHEREKKPPLVRSWLWIAFAITCFAVAFLGLVFYGVVSFSGD